MLTIYNLIITIILRLKFYKSRDGGIGRRTGLKIPR